MAETLTFENTQEATSVDNLTADEQDSLQVGEAMQEAQDDLLAGKYKDARELEKAYVELQSKLGEKSSKDNEPVNESEVQETEEVSEEKTETKEDTPEVNILDTLWDQAKSGEKFNDETIQQLNNMKPSELADMHLQYRAANQTPQLTEKDVTEIKNIAGGEQEYSNMLQWAEKNLNSQEIDMFDQVMEKGDPLAAFFAVRSLAYRYDDARGVDGKMITGNAPKSSGDQFRSQAEVVKAMSDPRYDRDPAYRQDIMNKLERSNVNF
jgi:hypothetical protein